MRYTIAVIAFLLFTFAASAQVPLNVGIQILKAEDARDFDGLKPWMFSKNIDIQSRAVLAAGRIGDGSSVDALAAIMENGDERVRPIAAFALGETENDQAWVFIVRMLEDTKAPADLRARAVEAAGKIAAANSKSTNAEALRKAIIEVLEFENKKRSAPFINVVRLALTAALRARPDGADEAIKPFLGYSDAGVVADALNALTRLRAKNCNAEARGLLSSSEDPVIRANAARLLGAAEDKAALDLLVKTAVSDDDIRPRVSAIRSLASLKDSKVVERLLDRGNILLDAYEKSKFANPVEKNELLEIVAVLGRLLVGTRDESAIAFLDRLRKGDDRMSPEISIAWTRIRPGKIGGSAVSPAGHWRQHSTIAQLAGEYATIESSNEEIRFIKEQLIEQLRKLVKIYAQADPGNVSESILAAPDDLRAFAAFKTDDLDDVLRDSLSSKDVFVRATTAELLADRPASKENVAALKTAFAKALITDKQYDDAQLAIMDALFKLDKKESVGSLLVALNAPDYLVRKKAFELLEDAELQKDFPGIPASLGAARNKHKDEVLPYTPVFGTKLGQVLNTDADYRRALSRKNGSVKAVLTTEKGTFTIDLLPEDAPLTVDNFVKLARSGYFNGVEVHRVVPNFVMQDGDPRGDGNGGPGWSIRCEINMVPYDRGAVGMALSGKDTGGSQWFVTHSPQPHLDGGYTVFGRVNEKDMAVVDNIVRGDKIISVKIVGR